MPKLTQEQLETFALDVEGMDEAEVKQVIGELLDHRKSEYYARGHRINDTQMALNATRKSRAHIDKQKELLMRVLLGQFSTNSLATLVNESATKEDHVIPTELTVDRKTGEKKKRKSVVEALLSRLDSEKKRQENQKPKLKQVESVKELAAKRALK